MKLRAVILLCLGSLACGKNTLPFYPDTDEAPVITLREDFINFLDSNTVSIFPMGLPEGKDLHPGEEIEITRMAPGEKVVSPIQGVITSVAPLDDKGENTNISIRYGRNYVVKHFHISNVPAHIVKGYKIEAGEVIGQTQVNPVNSIQYGGWEIAILKKEDNGCSYVCPYSFFDEKSRKVLDELMDKMPPTYAEKPYRWCYQEKVDGTVHCGEVDESYLQK